MAFREGSKHTVVKERRALDLKQKTKLDKTRLSTEDLQQPVDAFTSLQLRIPRHPGGESQQRARVRKRGSLHLGFLSWLSLFPIGSPGGDDGYLDLRVCCHIMPHSSVSRLLCVNLLATCLLLKHFFRTCWACLLGGKSEKHWMQVERPAPACGLLGSDWPDVPRCNLASWSSGPSWR